VEIYQKNEDLVEQGEIQEKQPKEVIKEKLIQSKQIDKKLDVS
jgi:hypothetical protein